jgi:3-phenylpropionate/trans-cinnamate dioxygenase ferredoxin reductase component
MKFTVDLHKCQDHGQCVFAAPEIFQLDDARRGRRHVSGSGHPSEGLSAGVVDDSRSERVVVVGGSLAGLRAVEGLRRGGFDGDIVVLSAEPLMPYNRPPLSKGRLSEEDREALAFRIPRAARDVEWRLGRSAASVDLDRRELTVDDGSRLSWDGLICATGLAPRRLPGQTEASRHVLRTIGDAEALFDAMSAAGTLTVVGAGFVGCEIAAVGARLGLEVHVIAPESVPMERVLGVDAGAAMRDRHVGEGVRFHLGRRIIGTDDHEGAPVLVLDDGARVPAYVVLEAIGASPSVGWLADAGIDLVDGILADEHLRVAGRADVFAAGDVVRWPNQRYDEVPRRIEHWTTAAESGRAAGENLARSLSGLPLEPFTPVPSFWSDQYETRIQSYGIPVLADEPIRILEGDLAAGFAAGYFRRGDLVGVVVIDLPERQAHYRQLLAESFVAQPPDAG